MAARRKRPAVGTAEHWAALNGTSQTVDGGPMFIVGEGCIRGRRAQSGLWSGPVQKSDCCNGNTEIGSSNAPRALPTKAATSSSGHSAMNRKAEPMTYSRSHSRAIQDRPNNSAASPVVFDPAKMSTTVSPGSVRNLMKNSGNERGNRPGLVRCCASCRAGYGWSYSPCLGTATDRGDGPAVVFAKIRANIVPRGTMLRWIERFRSSSTASCAHCTVPTPC